MLRIVGITNIWKCSLKGTVYISPPHTCARPAPRPCPNAARGTSAAISAIYRCKMHTAPMQAHRTPLGVGLVSSAQGPQTPAPIAGIAQYLRHRRGQISGLQRPASLCRAGLVPEAPLEPAIEDIPLADSDSFWLAPGPRPVLHTVVSPAPASQSAMRHCQQPPQPCAPRPRCDVLSTSAPLWAAGELSHINRLDFRTKPADVFRCFGCTEAECQACQLPPSSPAASAWAPSPLEHPAACY